MLPKQIKNFYIYIPALLVILLSSLFFYNTFSKKIIVNLISFNVVALSIIYFIEFKYKYELIKNKIQFLSFLLFSIFLTSASTYHITLRNNHFYHIYQLAPVLFLALYLYLDYINCSSSQKAIAFLLFFSTNTYYYTHSVFPELYLFHGIIIFTELASLDIKFSKINLINLICFLLLIVIYLFINGIGYQNISFLWILLTGAGFFILVKETVSNSSYEKAFFLSIFLGFTLFFIMYIINTPNVFKSYKINTEEFNSNRVGGYIAMAIPWLLYFPFNFFKRNTYLLKASFFIILFLSGLILFSCNSRGAIIAVFLALPILLLLKYTRNQMLKILALSVPTIFFAAITGLWMINLYLPGLTSKLHLYERSALRFEIWDLFLTTFKSIPIENQLFGIGSFNKDVLPVFVDNSSISHDLKFFIGIVKAKYVHTHNLFFESLLTFGVIGFIFFIYNVSKIYYKLIVNKLEDNSIYFISVISLSILFLHGSVDYLLDNVNTIYFLLLNLGIIFSYKSNKVDEIESAISINRALFYFMILLFACLTFFHLKYYTSITNHVKEIGVLRAINDKCPNYLVSNNALSKVDEKDLLSIESKINSDPIFTSYYNSKYIVLFGSFYQYLYKKYNNEIYFSKAESFYEKCYNNHIAPFTCMKLRQELYIDAKREMAISKSKLQNINTKESLFYTECTLNQ
jgi:hypothetical protein